MIFWKFEIFKLGNTVTRKPSIYRTNSIYCVIYLIRGNKWATSQTDSFSTFLTVPLWNVKRPLRLCCSTHMWPKMLILKDFFFFGLGAVNFVIFLFDDLVEPELGQVNFEMCLTHSAYDCLNYALSNMLRKSVWKSDIFYLMKIIIVCYEFPDFFVTYRLYLYWLFALTHMGYFCLQCNIYLFLYLLIVELYFHLLGPLVVYMYLSRPPFLRKPN